MQINLTPKRCGIVATWPHQPITYNAYNCMRIIYMSFFLTRMSHKAFYFVVVNSVTMYTLSALPKKSVSIRSLINLLSHRISFFFFFLSVSNTHLTRFYRKYQILHLQQQGNSPFSCPTCLWSHQGSPIIASESLC